MSGSCRRQDRVVRRASPRPAAARLGVEGSSACWPAGCPLLAVPRYKKETGRSGEGRLRRRNGSAPGQKPRRAAGRGLTTAAGGVLPDDAGLAAKALAIGVFQPGDLSPAQLRQALGLEASTDLVPTVSISSRRPRPGGVFVQGSLDEMIRPSGARATSSSSGGADWRLEWSRTRSRTEFLTPQGSRSYDLVPWPVLFVNGAIAALGRGRGDGGAVEIASTPDARRPRRR